MRDDDQLIGRGGCCGLLATADGDARRLIVKLCLTWGFIVASWAALGATTPLLLRDIVGPADAAWWQGVFTSTTALSGACLCTLLGHYSDRVGRMQMLLPWITAFFLSTVCVVYAEVLRSVWPLWLARLPALAAPSTILLAFASDIVHGKEVLEAHGLLGATFGIALLMGSLVCGVVGKFVSRLAALLVASAFATCSAFIASMAIVPPSRSPTSYGSPVSTTSSSKVASLASSSGQESLFEAALTVRRDPLLRLLVLGFALQRVGNVNSYFMFVLYTNARLGWETFDVSVALGLIGSLGVVWQLIGVKCIVSRFDNVLPFLAVALVIHPIAMIGYGFATTSGAMYALIVVGSAAGISASILTAKIAVLAAEVGAAGMALGLVGTVQNVLEVSSALLFGQLLSWTMKTYAIDNVLFGLPYFVNSLVYVASLLVLLYAHKRHGECRPQWVGNHDERKYSAE